ncbi:MAG: DNA cytosine methyltransferase [Pseudomonadota bacterium]
MGNCVAQRLDVVDLFAGLGGFSAGAQEAGARVVWAANHWPVACRFHAANHPTVVHVQQDLMQADWRNVPKHDVLLASPACQGHTPARGKEKPHHDALRSTAWAPVGCLEHHRSDYAVIENVPNFTRWVLYPSWVDALHRLGYSVSPHIIDSADHGVPQNRVRLFLVCAKSRHPIKLPLPKRQEAHAASFIEWDAHDWSQIHRPGRSKKTLDRIQAGRREFGDRFLIPYYSSGSGLKGRSIHRPLGTVTTVDRWAVIDGERMRMLQPTELRAAMGFRASYLLPETRRDAIHLLGNAVCPPVAADLIAALATAA